MTHYIKIPAIRLRNIFTNCPNFPQWMISSQTGGKNFIVYQNIRRKAAFKMKIVWSLHCLTVNSMIFLLKLKYLAGKILDDKS